MNWEQIGDARGFWWENQKERHYLEYVEVDIRIILKVSYRDRVG
jgi:hypothetical protein